ASPIFFHWVGGRSRAKNGFCLPGGPWGANSLDRAIVSWSSEFSDSTSGCLARLMQNRRVRRRSQSSSPGDRPLPTGPVRRNVAVPANDQVVIVHPDPQVRQAIRHVCATVHLGVIAYA